MWGPSRGSSSKQYGISFAKKLSGLQSIGALQNSVANVSQVGATANTTRVNTERSAPLLCQLCVSVLQPFRSKQTDICMCVNIKTYILTLVPVSVFLKEAVFICANKTVTEGMDCNIYTPQFLLALKKRGKGTGLSWWGEFWDLGIFAIVPDQSVEKLFEPCGLLQMTLQRMLKNSVQPSGSKITFTQSPFPLRKKFDVALFQLVCAICERRCEMFKLW